jgi:hypothetical protein
MPKNRRRAIHCEMLEPSKTSPGYFKYKITIREKDGSEHVVPAYGKDMQDAIERLIWNERIESVAEKKSTIPIFVGLGLSIVILAGVLSVENDNPIWILGALGVVLVTAISLNRIESYLKK